MQVLQLVRFRTHPTVPTEEMHSINERFQREVAPTLPGLIRREATVTPEGEWLLVLRYSDLAIAQQGRQTDIHEVSKLLMSKIDPATLTVSFHPIVSE